MRGVEFHMYPRKDDRRVGPPFSASGQVVVGRYVDGSSPTMAPIAAFMHDYYSVSAEEQRQMVLNTIALCEMKYAEQEVNNV